MSAHTKGLTQRIEALEALVSDLKLQNDLYRNLLEINEDAMFIKNQKRQLVFANQAFIKHFDSSLADRLLGKVVDEFYSKQQSDRFKASDKTAWDSGYYEDLEQICLPDETEISAKVAKKSFSSIDGNQYLACISRDVSENRKLIADLKRSNEDLDNFAYIASHDLKAPLNAIKTLLNWVVEDCREILPLESKDNLALALQRAGRMETLLSDLLAYSRIGREQTQPNIFNLRNKVLEWLSLVNLPMGFSIHCDDVEVYLPETPLNIVMVNLINNAIKHHDSAMANIKVKVRLNKKDTVIEVSDDGPGIADEHKQKVFELFQTLKSRDELEASGMGLSVVKKIVLHYGGSITIKDNIPKGSRFIVHWPFTRGCD